MPDPKFTKPWHGVPREEISWNPTIDESVCIGCGTCVTGCSRMVYRYDFERKKPVVVDPLNCMVGCTTCANNCPVHAISFPPLSSVQAMEGRPEVRHAIEDDLLTRRGELAWDKAVPHPDRIVYLTVAEIGYPGNNTLILKLMPKTAEDCMCQFTPGQYLEIWIPGHDWMSRAYSIGNAPHADGSIELQVRRVGGGRATQWLFEELRVDDELKARGPLGSFTMASLIDTPLLFIAGGTGLAPIKAMVEQQLELSSDRDMILVWGVTDSDDLYELDAMAEWMRRDSNLQCILALLHEPPADRIPEGFSVVLGTVANAISTLSDLSDRDVYMAGPPAMMPPAAAALAERGVEHNRIHADSFGL